MNYGTICSGIGAPECAWSPLGWNCIFQAETAIFPSAVLKAHYPTVPNYGDLLNFRKWPDHAIELICGGTPCQSFSVAGLRRGLDDPRGNLTLAYLGVIDKYRPRWVVWENVPGVLSDKTGAFGKFLAGLAELGYGFAYRVLDAKYAGVPQQRRRVFVVGYFGNWRPAAAVLFERESLSGNPPPCKKKGEGFASEVAPGIGASGRGFSRDGESRGQDPVISLYGGNTLAENSRGSGLGVSESNIMYTLTKTAQHAVGIPEVAWALQERDSKGPDSDTKPGHLIPVCLHGTQDPCVSNTAFAQGRNSGQENMVALGISGSETGFSLRANPSHSGDKGDGGVNTNLALAGIRVRRLTPIECERLQGFPDNFTNIKYRGKPAADGPRYKALGNSMAVPVVRWIGERIEAVEKVLRG